MDRGDVYALVEEQGEGREHEVGGWLLIMEEMLGAARSAWAYGHGDAAALHWLLKGVAAGVACLEQHGGPAVSARPRPPDFITVPQTVSALLLTECHEQEDLEAIVAGWTDEQRRESWVWAWTEHLRAHNSPEGVGIPRPAFLPRSTPRIRRTA